MAKKQTGINEEPSLDIQNPIYSEGLDSVGDGQTDFVPNTSYIGSTDNIGGNVGSYVGASYVGADQGVVTATNRKKGNFRKTLLVSIITLAVVSALVAFVIWPMLIYPNMSNADLYTPEILQSYCASNGKKDTILTFTECSAEGQVMAVWEIINDGQYGKVNLVGQITEKKNNGDMVINWVSNSVEMMPSGSSWKDEQSASISNNFTVIKTDAQELTAGVNDEYSIKSAADFAKLSGSSATFFLKNDIDFAGQNWTPIKDFSGMLMGNGYTIKNLTINASTSNVGLFATLKGRVQNLKFENAQITVSGSQENVGILCGKLTGDVKNVTTAGKVTASSSKNVGGIAGLVEKNDAKLAGGSLENKADVTGANNVGGIFGKFNNQYGSSSASTQLSACSNSGAITGKSNVGGLIGDCSAKNILTITDFSNTGAVKGTQNVGGVVGYAYAYEDKDGSIISNSSCAAAITGETYVGCIAGKAEGLLINSCTNTGSTLTATKYVTVDGMKVACVGGFAGMANGANDCINEVTIQYTGGGAYVGGIVGYVERNNNLVTLSNLENKANITGADYVGGIFGKLYNKYGSSSAKTQLSTFNNSGIITGKSNVGGLIGDCYARNMLYVLDFVNSGNVSGSGNVGGVIGHAYGYKGSYIRDSSTTSGVICGKSEDVTIG